MKLYEKIKSFMAHTVIVLLSTLGIAVILYECWAMIVILVKMITQQ